MYFKQTVLPGPRKLSWPALPKTTAGGRTFHGSIIFYHGHTDGYNFGTFPDKFIAFFFKEKNITYTASQSNHVSARGLTEMGYFYKTFAMLLLFSLILLLSVLFFKPSYCIAHASAAVGIFVFC
jgi:hypothetical protein